jgi:hypothetical protein
MKNRFTIGVSLNVLAVLLVMVGLYLTRLYSYLLFHSLVEVFSIVVGCGIFMIAWNSRRLLNNNCLLFLGIGFLFTGFLDLIHTLAYRGMGVFPERKGDLAVELWVATRYMGSLSFLLAPLFIRRRIIPGLVIAGYALVAGLILGSIFYWRIFPECYIEGQGLTVFKVVSEYIICLILMAALWYFVAERSSFDKTVVALLVAALATNVASELAFTFYVDVYGTWNLIGHFLKLISFYFIYRAIVATALVKPYNLLFRELKQSEEELRAAVNFRERILSTAATAIFTVDAQRRITSVNEEFCTMTGFTPDELIGKGCDTFCGHGGGDARDFLTLDPAKPISKQHRTIRTKTGEHLTVIWNADTIVDAAGGITGGIASFVDVTALVKAREAAEAASRAKSAFLANMSHELRTPLTAVIGFAKYLEDGLGGPLNEEQKNFLTRIHEGGQHLLSLISDILDLATVEAGKLQVEAKPLQLPLEIEWSLILMREKAAAHGIALTSHVSDDLPAVAGDERAVRQILLNLLNNAVKFTPDRGKIEVNAFPYGEFVAVEVVDTGIGIAPEDMDKVFGVFERGSGIRDRQIEGTGLGLPLVRGLVTALGGAITVASEVGKGSRFTFTLPKAPAA